MLHIAANEQAHVLPILPVHLMFSFTRNSSEYSCPHSVLL